VIKASKLIYDFDREYARFNTSHAKKLKLIDKVAIINKAQDILVRYAAPLVETDSRYRNILIPIEEKGVELKEVRKSDLYTVYEGKSDSVRVLSNRVSIKKEGCGTKELDLTLLRTDALNRARNNPNWKSSFAWEQVIGDGGNEGLIVYHEGDFEILKVYQDYIRKPQTIHIPSLSKPSGTYVDWNKETITKDADCELDKGYADVIITNLAVMIASSTTNDTNKYALKIKEIVESSQVSTI